MLKNENFIRNPYSFGFKDILFPEESKLHVENEEAWISSDEKNRIVDKINQLTPKEVNKIIDDNNITSMGELFCYVLKYASIDKLFDTVDIGVISEQIEYRSPDGSRQLIIDREKEIDLSTSLKFCIHAKGRIILRNEERFLKISLHLGVFEGVYSTIELSEIRRNETGLSYGFKRLIEDLLSMYTTSHICSPKDFRDTYFRSSKELLSSILQEVGPISSSSYFNPKIGKEIFLSDLSNYDSKNSVNGLFRQIKNNQDFAFAIERLVKGNLFFGTELILETFRHSYVSRTNLLQVPLSRSINLAEEMGFYPSFEIRHVYPSVFLKLSRSSIPKSFVFNEENKEEHQEQREFLYLKSREALDGYAIPQWMSFKRSLSGVTDNIFSESQEIPF